MKFYMAGPFSEIERLKDAAVIISQVSGWKCNSRWLKGIHHEAYPIQAAQDDLKDVRTSDALVIDMNMGSTRGGMWVEFGVALQAEIPIVVVAAYRTARFNVFVYLNGIFVVNFYENAGDMLVKIKKEGRLVKAPPNYKR